MNSTASTANERNKRQAPSANSTLWGMTFVDHCGAPAGLAHALEVGRVGGEHLDPFGNESPTAAVDGPDPLPPGGELARDDTAGRPAGPHDDVQFVSLLHHETLLFPV